MPSVQSEFHCVVHNVANVSKCARRLAALSDFATTLTRLLCAQTSCPPPVVDHHLPLPWSKVFGLLVIPTTDIKT